FGTGEYADQQIFNSTVLVDRQGDVAAVYRMVRPVPFGEYVPGRALLERIGLGAWTRGLLPLDLSRGSDYQPLGEYGTPICFESVFPAAARAFAQNGASLLVTVTNDAWFNGSSELRAHFSTAVFRAVETRRWTVQVANGGVSGVVDSSGRIRSAILGEGVIVERGVKLLSAVSLYTRWGDGPLLIAMVLIACVSFAVRPLLRRNKRGE
ncbi:apolipoprotein N-acyltransferase, partial [Candidatus Bipolaricaulota bacterium]|nr:apolipoprotein N-acyltransferase [Candidatus Bipolaricaulota bacterium]